MEPRSRITPVWLVTRGIKSNPVLLRRLLDLGADPDVASASKPDPRVETWPGYPGKVTPLELAIDNGSAECIKLLLEAKKSRKTSLNPTILYKAPNNFEITKMLLDHGADPNPPALESKSLIEFLVSRVVDHFLPDSENGNWHPDKIWPVIELLLERGSKVSPEWENRDFQGCHEGIRALLIRRVSYPKWAGEKVVRICHFHPNSHRFSKLNLAVQGGEETTPALGRLLLDQEKGTIGYLEKDFTTLVLMRKLNGEVKEQAFINLIGGEPFPKLEWGDILEIRDTRNSWSGGGNPWPWPQATREALERSVKTSSEPAQE